MPVTARLSRLFYERLGEEVANELVDWFNAVDAAYRGELREFNELNFSRFDSKLEQRAAELHARIDRVSAEVGARIETVAAELHARIDKVSSELNAKIDSLGVELHARIDKVSAELTARIDQRFAEAQAMLDQRLAEQTRWLFVMWASLLIPIIGLWIRG